MPGNMDERVVAMEFDNRKFEKNVKTSMKTLDDLKEALDFDETGDSLDEFDKKCKKFGKDNVFKDMDESVFSLRKGLGLLGDTAKSTFAQFAQITKITAMVELAERAFHKLEAAIKRLTIGPISKGFDKYTTKIGSIKTIANATGMAADDVNDSLDRLNWFTDETSASFEEMVNNIGKFTSVGRGLDESITAMEGIAAWGYHSGANVQEMNRAMYNLSQALGTGTVKLIDWKSIENAGMATKEFKEQVLAAAEAEGTLIRRGDKLFTKNGNKEVNFSNFNGTLAQGWFTSDVLMRTLKEYGGFADEVRAYQEKHPMYETAAEAMEHMDLDRLNDRLKLFGENLDDVAAKSGKDVKKLRREYDELQKYASSDDATYEELEKRMDTFAKSLGIDMEDVRRINKIANPAEREKEIRKWAETIGVDVKQATKILDGLAETEETLGEKAFKSSQQAKSFSEALDATLDAVSTGWMNSFQIIFGGLEDSIALWSDVTEILYELFASGATARNNALTHWAEEFNGRDDLWGKDGILHSIMDTIIELKELLGSSFKNVFFPDLERAIGLVSTEEGRDLSNGLYTIDQIRFRREGSYMGRQLKSITNAIKEFGLAIRNFVQSNMDKFRTIFTSAATVLKFFGHIIGSVFSAVGKFIGDSGILQDIMDLFARISDFIRRITERIQASGFITTFFEKIADTLTWFYKTVKKWINQIGEFFEETGIGQAIRDFFGSIADFFLGGKDDIDENGRRTESAFFRAFGWVKSIKEWFDKIDLKAALYTVKMFIDNFGQIWGAFVGGLNGESVDKDALIAGGMDNKLAGIISAFSGFGNKISGVFQFLKGVFESVVGWLESSGILPAIRNAWDWIKTFFGNIGLLWDIFVRGKEIDPKDLTDKQAALVKGIRGFTQKLKNAWNKLSGWISTAWEWIKERWNGLVGWLEATGVLPKIRSVWKTIKDFFGNIGLLWDIFITKQGKYDPKDLTEDQLSIVQKIERFINAVREKFEWIRDTFIRIKDTVIGWLESSGILPTLREWWSAITGWFDSLFVPSAEGEGSPLESIKTFFENLWKRIKELFGGSESPEFDENGMALPQIKKPGFLSRMFNNIREAFTNEDGSLNIGKGIAISLREGIKWLIDIFKGIDWKGIFSFIADTLVTGINAVDDAMGNLHIDNIIAVIKKVANAISGILIAKTVSDVTSIAKSVVKKGKDKSIFEKFTDILKAIGTALLQAGLAFALIAGSIWLLSKISPGDLFKSMLVLGAIALFFAAMIVVAYFFAKNKGFAANVKAMSQMFINIGIAVGLIVASIAVLSLLMKFGVNIWGALGIVALIMLAMVGIIFLLSKITKGNTVRISAGIAVFAGMAILLATITVCILLLQLIDFGRAVLNLILLGAAMAGIIAAIKIMDKVKISPKTFAAMIVMAAILAIIAAAFILLQDADPLTLAVIAVGFAAVILAMAGAMVIISKLDPGATIKGTLAFAAALAILAVAFKLITGLVTSAVLQITNTIVHVMADLAAASTSASMIDHEAIKSAFALLGEIAGFFVELATKSYSTETALQIARDAWSVCNELAIAGVAAKMIDVNDFYKIFGENGDGGLFAVIQKALSSVTDTGYKASRLGNNVEQLAESMKLVGQAGVMLDKELVNAEGIGTGQTYTQGINAVKERLTDIQEIVAMAVSLGTSGEGEDVRTVDLTKFASGIANIGASLQLYNKAVAQFISDASNGTNTLDGSDISPISTENIRAALDTVIGALQEVTIDPTQREAIESWATMNTGDNGATLFALGLTNIADSMSIFSNAAQDFNNENVDKAIESLGTLATIHNSLTNPSEYKSTIDGVTSWGDSGDPNTNGSFANAISSMGTAMATFGQSVKDIPYDSVDKATTALDTLAALYERLKDKDDMLTYFSDPRNAELYAKFAKDNSADAVFSDFGAGIGKLGSALATLNQYITSDTYDQDKVDLAIQMIQDIADIHTKLLETKVADGWWDRLWFGTNDIDTLGSNMSALGSRLAGFSQQLASFDVDINSDKWANVIGVLNYLKEVQLELISQAQNTYEYNENGTIQSSVEHNVDGLDHIIKSIGQLIDKLKAFDEMMHSVTKVNDKNYEFGTWDQNRWDKYKNIITFFKKIAIELGNGQFNRGLYDLGNFGDNLGTLFSRIDNGEKLTRLMTFISATGEKAIDIDKFSSFIETIKILSETAGILHEKGVVASDITVLGSILNALGGLDPKELDASKFNLSGVTAASQFVNGLYLVLSGSESAGDLRTPGTVFRELIDVVITGFESEFYEKGRIAGEQYAMGFSEGVSGLSPITNIDSDGNTTNAGSAGSGRMTLVDVLDSFKYATSADMSLVLERLDTLNGKFNAPINVRDQHDDLLNAFSRVDTRLQTINGDLRSLRGDVNNMKIYINKAALVGAIGADMDRYLGKTKNMIPVSRPRR